MKQPGNKLYWSFVWGDGVQPATVSVMSHDGVNTERFAAVGKGATASSAFRAAAKRLRRMAKEADREALRLRDVPAGGYR